MSTTGQVKFYHSGKGYGFLTDDAAPQAGGIFFHISNVRDEYDSGVESVDVGDRVSFSVEASRKKVDEFSAYNIKLLGE